MSICSYLINRFRMRRETSPLWGRLFQFAESIHQRSTYCAKCGSEFATSFLLYPPRLFASPSVVGGSEDGPDRESVGMERSPVQDVAQSQAGSWLRPIVLQVY